MRICVNCGNEYPCQEQSCLWCGYPANMNDYPQKEFTNRLRPRFDLIRVRRNMWTLWDSDRQRKLLCRMIPEGKSGNHVMMMLDQINSLVDVSPFPKLLEVYRQGEEEGDYLTEHISGITLRSIIEKQNPPDVSYVDQIARELYILISRILISPIRHGSLNLDNLVIRQDGMIIPNDYGKGIVKDPDEDVTQIFRIMMRLYSGEWQYLSNTAGVESKIRKLRERTLSMQK